MAPLLGVGSRRRTPQFGDQLLRAAKFSYTYFQQFAGDDYAVRWLPSYIASDTPISDTGLLGPKGPFGELFPEMRDLQPGEHRFPYHYVRQFRAMLIEPHPYLRALLRDFHLAGGRLVVQEFHDLPEIASLLQQVVVNCTGLGARALFADNDLIPIQGQLTYLLPQPEVKYIALAGDFYMFPRRDGIVLGGTHVRDEWSLQPDLAAKQRVLAGHAHLFSNL